MLRVFVKFVIQDFSLYIDLASGSAMIQMLVGALAGIGIAVRVYWNQIKMKIIKK